MSYFETEWLDENMHRNYPLADDASGKDSSGAFLPTSFLVDMFIATPPSKDVGSGNRFFVSGVDLFGDSVKVRVSYMAPSGAVYLVASSADIPLSVRAGDLVSARTFPLLSENSSYGSMAYISGSLIVGTCEDLTRNKSYVLDYAGGKILSSIIIQNISGIARISAEGTDGSTNTFLSAFVIRAGDGISLGVSEELSGGSLRQVLTITRVETSEESSATYKTVDDVVDAVKEKLGNPILSINGVLPDASGAFLITPEDCTSITAGGGGLVLSNPCAKPCCDTASDATITAAISALEAAANRVNSYFQGQAVTINIINSGLASLMASRK